MDWGMFDGALFDSVHQMAGSWIVRVRGQRIEIQIVVDANGRYYYRNSHWFKNRQSQRPHNTNRGFASLEQALGQAVKDLRAPFAGGSFSGEWVPMD